jgi:hypothetical protein
MQRLVSQIPAAGEGGEHFPEAMTVFSTLCDWAGKLDKVREGVDSS